MKNKFTLGFPQPFVVMLIGVPNSGKDTFIKNNLTDKNIRIISRDDIITELNPTLDYNAAYKVADHAKVNRILADNIRNAALHHVNTVLNLTNLVKSRREKMLKYFDNTYYKVAVVFPLLSDEEYSHRNDKRTKEEGKTISNEVMKTMKNRFETVTADENFNKLIIL